MKDQKLKVKTIDKKYGIGTLQSNRINEIMGRVQISKKDSGILILF